MVPEPTWLSSYISSNCIHSYNLVISCFVCRWSRHYLAAFCIVFDCIHPTHVAISCFVCRWSKHLPVRVLYCIYSTHVASAVCLQVVPAPTWLSSLLSLIVFIPPTWQSSVLSAGGPGTYLAEFSIVFIPPTWQSAVLSAGGPGTTWQSYVLYLFHPRGNQLFCLQVVPALAGRVLYCL